MKNKLFFIFLTCFLCGHAGAQDTMSKYILTPQAGPLPCINGPKVFGVRPGHPVLFTIPATGERPMTYAVEGLPAGLRLDAQTGQLSGAVDQAGDYLVKLRVKNELGEAVRTLKIT